MELIFTLFAVAILLFIIEVFLTPGTSVFGVIGIILIFYADYLAFKNLSMPWPWVVFIFSILLLVGFVYWVYNVIRSKYSINTEIESKVNVIPEGVFHVGQQGVSVTALRPEGTAKFGSHVTPVYSTGDYIEDEVNIEITKITSNKIFVKPII